MPQYAHLISANALKTANNPVILDCRFRLEDSDWGYNAFLQGHIAGAHYVSLNKDLSGPPGLAGRHPLPNREKFLRTARSWGITSSRQVVVYDDVGGAMAARAWWLLRWIGHAQVAVLDGGLATWSEPLISGKADPAVRGDLPLKPPLTQAITMQSLASRISTKDTPRLIDARSHTRWAGKEEPIDPVAGHIPGALCLPFQDNLTPDGHFKSAKTLRLRFSNALTSGKTGDLEHLVDDVVCYCGSGVTATHNILAMCIAGLREPQLFAESWSGWITDNGRPIKTDTLH